eukprot:COSAG05_NODE_1054_length_6012_cov_63.809572_6_plen_133_part_00
MGDDMRRTSTATLVATMASHLAAQGIRHTQAQKYAEILVQNDFDSVGSLSTATAAQLSRLGMSEGALSKLQLGLPEGVPPDTIQGGVAAGIVYRWRWDQGFDTSANHPEDRVSVHEQAAVPRCVRILASGRA